MAEISIPFKADQMGLINLGDELSEDVLSKLYIVTAQAAQLTYNKAVELAAEKLNTTYLDYVSGLDLEETSPGTFELSLDDSKKNLEEGYGAYPMLPRLAMGPKSKQTKDGHRYTVIPLRKFTEAKDPNNPRHQMMAQNLRDAIKGGEFKEVRRGYNKETGKFTTMERLKDNPEVHPYLKGLVRIREYKELTYEALNGGSMAGASIASSMYMTFRTASTKQNPGENWVHPGFKGARIFDDLAIFADQVVEDVIYEIFGD